MSAAPLAFFCTTGEGLDFACGLAERVSLPLAFFSFRMGEGYSRTRIQDISERDQLRIFIVDCELSDGLNFNAFVEAHANSVAIDIKIGGLLLEPPTLLMSTFESGKGSTAAAKAALAWLKRNLKSEVSFGVMGGDQATGEGRLYNNIGFTSGAMLLFGTGTLWRSGRSHLSTFWPSEV